MGNASFPPIHYFLVEEIVDYYGRFAMLGAHGVVVADVRQSLGLAEGRHGIFKNPVLMRIGEKYGKTSVQVALKFLIQNDIIIIPKTTHKERMVENINLFDFTLSDEDLREICLLDTGRNVTGWPSDALKYNPESV